MTLAVKIIFPCLLLLLACQTESEQKESLPKKVEGPAYSKVPGKLGLIHQMQGRWKDSEIKNAELVISGNQFISIYRDEVRDRSTFEVFKKCPKKCGGKKAPKGLAYFIVHRKTGDFCYVLNSFENGMLEYAPLEQE